MVSGRAGRVVAIWVRTWSNKIPSTGLTTPQKLTCPSSILDTRTRRESRRASARCRARSGSAAMISPGSALMTRDHGIVAAAWLSFWSTSRAAAAGRWAHSRQIRFACQTRTFPASTACQSRGWRSRRSRALPIREIAAWGEIPSTGPSSRARNSPTCGVPSWPGCINCSIPASTAAVSTCQRSAVWVIVTNSATSAASNWSCACINASKACLLVSCRARNSGSQMGVSMTPL